MSSVMIEVENVGKRYWLHHEAPERYTALRDVLARKMKGLFRAQGSKPKASSSDEDFWALKDVSFQINQGEVVGIIGRNGAGKSTLLKILSRITEPTKGRIRLKGRVASLLEVGTGFHPELTGRENIFLNGAILGMSKAEIRSKFDAIVAFAEVERFLDTPVKRYSSGMYVRLAFAVAAHLEPEILVIDEVLAVGDAQFQKKCLGKMNEVAKTGRTVLFVSHNMPSIRALCSRGIVLREGRVVFDGGVEDAITAYSDEGGAPSRRAWDSSSAPGDATLQLLGIEIVQDGSGGLIDSSKPARVMMEVECTKIEEGLCIGFELFSQEGGTLWWSYHSDGAPAEWPTLHPGRNRLACEIPAGWLNGGLYSVAPRIGIHNRRWIVNLPPCLEFTVAMNHGRSPFWTSLASGRRPGQLAPVLRWEAA